MIKVLAFDVSETLQTQSYNDDGLGQRVVVEIDGEEDTSYLIIKGGDTTVERLKDAQKNNIPIFLVTNNGLSDADPEVINRTLNFFQNYGITIPHENYLGPSKGDDGSKIPRLNQIVTKYNLKKEEVLFFDDSHLNWTEAVTDGYTNAVHVTSAKALHEGLDFLTHQSQVSNERPNELDVAGTQPLTQENPIPVLAKGLKTVFQSWGDVKDLEILINELQSVPAATPLREFLINKFKARPNDLILPLLLTEQGEAVLNFLTGDELTKNIIIFLKSKLKAQLDLGRLHGRQYKILKTALENLSKVKPTDGKDFSNLIEQLQRVYIEAASNNQTIQQPPLIDVLEKLHLSQPGNSLVSALVSKEFKIHIRNITLSDDIDKTAAIIQGILNENLTRTPIQSNPDALKKPEPAAQPGRIVPSQPSLNEQNSEGITDNQADQNTLVEDVMTTYKGALQNAIRNAKKAYDEHVETISSKTPKSSRGKHGFFTSFRHGGHITNTSVSKLLINIDKKDDVGSINEELSLFFNGKNKTYPDKATYNVHSFRSYLLDELSWLAKTHEQPGLDEAYRPTNDNTKPKRYTPESWNELNKQLINITQLDSDSDSLQVTSNSSTKNNK